MYKKNILILVLIFSMIFLSKIAYSSVIGTWQIDGNIKTIFKIKGIKSKTVRETFNDVWKFKSDYSFESNNIRGTWIQKKTKVFVYFDDNDIISFFENKLSSQLGLNVLVEKITKKVCSVTENSKKRQIKGSFNISMDINIYDNSYNYNRAGKATISVNFTGELPDGECINIAGTWKGTAKAFGGTTQITFYLLQDRCKISGTIKSSNTCPPPCNLLGSVNLIGIVNKNIFSFTVPESPTVDCEECEVICYGTDFGTLTVVGNKMSGNGKGEDCETGEYDDFTLNLTLLNSTSSLNILEQNGDFKKSSIFYLKKL